MPVPPTLSSERLQRIVDELGRLGYETTRSVTTIEACSAIRSDASFGCVMVEWSLKESESEVETFVKFIRERGLDVPVFILVKRHLLEEIPVAVLGQVTGYVFIDEDTPEFVAATWSVTCKAMQSHSRLPFLARWLTMRASQPDVDVSGHNGGVFYQKSPIGVHLSSIWVRRFFRNDIDNSVVELGDLLIHEGPALAAEKAAAQIFGRTAPILY